MNPNEMTMHIVSKDSNRFETWYIMGSTNLHNTETIPQISPDTKAMQQYMIQSIIASFMVGYDLTSIL
jgi:hypothetical protein